MGEPRRPIEDIAADEIAADEERSRGWVAPKALVGSPTPQLQPAQNPLIAWIFQFGAGPVIVAVALLLLVLVGAFALFQPGPPPQPTDVAQATPTAVPTPTDQPATPELTPTEQPPPTPTPTQAPTATPGPTGTPVAFAPDDVGDAITDSGQPVPDDAVVDIAGANVSRASDGSIEAIVMQVAPMPSDTNSRAQQLVIGRHEVTEAGVGIVLAQTRTTFFAQRIWFWQLHEGVLTMGSFDDETRDDLPTEATIFHDLENGTFTFHIPVAELPDEASWIGFRSFHRPERDDERRIDLFNPVLFDDLPIP